MSKKKLAFHIFMVMLTEGFWGIYLIIRLYNTKNGGESVRVV